MEPVKQKPKSVVTPVGRLSFPSLDKPRAKKDESGNSSGVERYEATILIPKTPNCNDWRTDPVLKDLVAELSRVVNEKFPDKNSRPKGMHYPIKDGDQPDASWEGLEGYAGQWFIRTWSVRLPGMIDAGKHPVKGDIFYAGCYVRLAVNAFYFKNTQKQGFSFGLNHVMFVRDGESFGGADSTEDAFAAVKAEDVPAPSFGGIDEAF